MMLTTGDGGSTSRKFQNFREVARTHDAAITNNPPKEKALSDVDNSATSVENAFG
jgi:hypothetical protein